VKKSGAVKTELTALKTNIVKYLTDKAANAEGGSVLVLIFLAMSLMRSWAS